MSEMDVVRNIEACDPSNVRFHQLPKDKSRLVVSGCGVARYCSEECQRLHWPRHQKECLAYQAALRKTEDIERQICARREALERHADAPR